MKGNFIFNKTIIPLLIIILAEILQLKLMAGPDAYPFYSNYPQSFNFYKYNDNLLILPRWKGENEWGANPIGNNQILIYDIDTHSLISRDIDSVNIGSRTNFGSNYKSVDSKFHYENSEYLLQNFGFIKKTEKLIDTILIPSLSREKYNEISNGANYYLYECDIQSNLKKEENSVSPCISFALIKDSLVFVGFGEGFAEGVGNPGGFAIFNMKSSEWKVIWEKKLFDASIGGIYPVSNSKIWLAFHQPAEYFGTPGGLWVYDMTNDTLTIIDQEGIFAESIVFHNNLVITLGPYGISIYDKIIDKWQNYHWILDVNKDHSGIVSNLVETKEYNELKKIFPNRNTACYFASLYEVNDIDGFLNKFNEKCDLDLGNWLYGEEYKIPIEVYKYIPVEDLIDSPKGSIRNAVIDLMKRKESPLLNEYLKNQLTSDDFFKKYSAIKELKNLGDSSHIGLLRDYATPKTPSTQLYYSAIELYRVGDKSGLEEVIRRLDKNPTSADSYLVNALKEMKDSSAVRTLIKVLNLHKDDILLQRATIALTNIKSQESFEYLVECINGRKATRYLSLNFFQHNEIPRFIYSKLIPVIEKIAVDENDSRQKKAVDILNKIKNN